MSKLNTSNSNRALFNIGVGEKVQISFVNQICHRHPNTMTFTIQATIKKNA